MEERGKVTGLGAAGAGVGVFWVDVCAVVWEVAIPNGTPARATVFRKPRRPVGLVSGICCDCIIFPNDVAQPLLAAAIALLRSRRVKPGCRLPFTALHSCQVARPVC